MNLLLNVTKFSSVPIQRLKCNIDFDDWKMMITFYLHKITGVIFRNFILTCQSTFVDGDAIVTRCHMSHVTLTLDLFDSSGYALGEAVVLQLSRM